ncbi:amine oxidase [Vibrio nigripulchritudo]|uniref:flavin monoamine oxidase family protein n=1 Tax=Vibrio nigripulchritudo TaxID=28173 RepID=UPI00190CE1D1|nr:FAD-dependent oxidoreductase [Vibrio nigripulchritudo]BCL71770.1 amine oxidase [Vibrio nigripulchritudo]BDU33128.1 amine oxidase [Vibrio nigripulchritudo]
MTKTLDDAYHGLLPFDQDQISQAYLSYLQNGLPTSQAQAKNILIVGCGISGMVSATLLRQAGHNVTIVEANTRVGGRVKTFRNTNDKTYFEDSNLTGEAGAMRIPDMHKLVQYLIDQTGVDKQLFLNKTVSKADATSEQIDNPDRDENGDIILPPSTGKNFLHVNYRHVLRKDYDAEGADVNALLNYNLEDNENTQASVLLDNAISELTKMVEEDPKTAWAYIIDTYGEYSMRRYLLEYVENSEHYSENAIEMIGVIENLASRMSYSFIQSFIELAIIKPDTEFWLIKGGTDLFTTAYFEQNNLSDVTLSNQTLTDLYLDENTGKVRIHTSVSEAIASREEQDKNVQADLAQQEWDEVVVTVPFPSFRTVHVWPEFSQRKRQAIRELHYDAATKVLLEFRERFWETENDIYGGGSCTDLINRFMYYPSERMGSTGGGVMLVSYSWADDARKWDSMPHYERFCYALENVAITHAVHAPDASYEERLIAQQKIKDLCVFDPEKYVDDQDNIVGAATVSWMQNPYAFGEAAIYYPGQLELFHKSIIASEWQGKAHFAGEHASLKHAWIEGAIESAVNAALMVNENPLPALS